MVAPAAAVTAADPFVTVRAWNRMRAAGFVLELEDGRLMVEPLSRLSEKQHAYLHAHKPALVELLTDAELLAAALALAGPAGLGWMEGTPADWDGVRLLAAGEVLYASRRMVSRDGRRYAREHAPPPPPFREYRVPDISPAMLPGIGSDPLGIAPDISPDIASPQNVIPLDREAYEERAAIMEYDGGLPRGEAEQKALALAIRAAELQAQGWSPWNAQARAESEALPGWEATP